MGGAPKQKEPGDKSGRRDDGERRRRACEKPFPGFRGFRQASSECEGIPIWSTQDLQPGFRDYAALNEGKTFGLLRVFDPDDRPTLLDVALYRQLPNDVPLLRGIIT